jgi:hypothetical protein
MIIIIITYYYYYYYYYYTKTYAPVIVIVYRCIQNVISFITVVIYDTAIRIYTVTLRRESSILNATCYFSHVYVGFDGRFEAYIYSCLLLAYWIYYTNRYPKRNERVCTEISG